MSEKDRIRDLQGALADAIAQYDRAELPWKYYETGPPGSDWTEIGEGAYGLVRDDE